MTKKKARALIRRILDFVLWRTPLLQELVLQAARRGLVPSWVWRRLHPRGVWNLHAPDGTCFAYDSVYEHDGLARNIVWTDMRDWETGTQPVLFGLAGKARVFVDVGAYSGVYTVLACMANPQLKVVAFEPNPVKLPQLRANVAANGLEDRVTLIGKALGDRTGKAVLTIPVDDSAASLKDTGTGVRAIDVEVTTGDLVLDGLPVDLVKVDVEGLEPEVLTGMSRILASRQPEIIAECLSPQALQRLCHCASGFGYQHAYRIDHDNLVPVGRCSFRSANYLLSVTPMPAREEEPAVPGAPSPFR
ncbi:MAG TPA: FkbM family methyltransferase [Streptosporangiaceae bacterium]|nr:FkbM family methyltransferase [Streptosporangiaceae bacterium]